MNSGVYSFGQKFEHETYLHVTLILVDTFDYMF